MPQTSPMNWLLLSNLFFILFYFSNSMMISNNSMNISMMLMLKFKNWSW